MGQSDDSDGHASSGFHPCHSISMLAHNPIPALAPAAIHLWFLDLTKNDQDGHFLACLNPEEQHRAERFLAETARLSFIRARGRLKTLLGQYLDIEPRAVTFIHNDHGKPRLADTLENQGLVFNISHSGDYAVFAFARDIALGVDIELPKPRLDLQGLTDYCLAPEELAQWQRLPAAEQLTGFIRFWVCKEAFVKAAGRGIALGLTKVCVRGGCDGFEYIPEAYGLAQDWRLTEWAHDGHRVAVAYYGAPCEISIFG